MIKFSFKKENQRALALLIGVLPIMSAKDLDQLDLNSFGFKNVLANGPYKIKQYASNKFIEYERVKDYWGEDLPCQKNHHNFDIIRFEYFRNYDAAFEAFKAGEIDLFQEEDIGHWLKNYNFPATKKGDVQLREIPHQRPCVFGFVFNTRRLLFQNKLVRKALSLALDLDHLNKNYFHNAYEVIDSFFGNSDLSALLEKQIKPYEARQNLSDASALLKQAGFKINRNQLSDLKTGKPFVFEILLQNPLYERIALTFKNNLEKLGIVAHISLVNSALYQKRLNDFDYDMIIHQWQQSLAPDREQLRYWGSKAAQIAGSANYAGISDPEIDVLLEKLLIQKNREGIIKITHALDRALQSGYYVIPLLQKTRDFIAYWNKFGHPKSQPVSAFPLLKWWCVQTWWQNDMSHSFE